MKTVLNTALLVVFCLVLTSCGSDNLTHSKAKKIINTCLKENPKYKRVKMYVGQKKLRKELEKYQSLQDQGFLIITSLKAKITKKTDNEAAQSRVKDKYDIQITDKTKPYILEGLKGNNYVYVKGYDYAVNKILEVQEIPSKNIAKVKVQYKRINNTPFEILYLDPDSKFDTETVTMKKTANGWKYCDNY